MMSGAFLLWFVAEIISFSPNTYDNNKFLYVTYVFVCCLSAGYGIDLLRSLKKKKFLAYPVPDQHGASVYRLRRTVTWQRTDIRLHRIL